MQNELEEISVAPEDHKKPTHFPTMAFAIIALILSIYAAIVGTYNLYDTMSHQNHFAQSTLNFAAFTKQQNEAMLALQLSVATLQKEAKQKTEKLQDPVQKIFSDIASINQQIQAMSVLPKAP